MYTPLPFRTGKYNPIVPAVPACDTWHTPLGMSIIDKYVALSDLTKTKPSAGGAYVLFEPVIDVIYPDMSIRDA